jgi:hypothetical protein
MIAALLVLALAAGAVAVERPFIYQGTIEQVDTASRNVTIVPFAEYAGGAWTGVNRTPLVGTAPTGADLSALTTGGTVEAASLGKPGGRWSLIAAIQPLSSRPVSLATAVYGDPSFLVSRLPGDLQVQYSTEADCTGTGDGRGLGLRNATSANLTVATDAGESRTLALMVGEEKTTELNGTAVRVRFNGGQASPSGDCSGPAGLQPVADFTIITSGGSVASPSAGRTASPAGPTEEASGFTLVAGLAALATVALGVRRR